MRHVNPKSAYLKRVKLAYMYGARKTNPHIKCVVRRVGARRVNVLLKALDNVRTAAILW